MLSYGAILSRNARPSLQKRTLDLAKKEGCFKNKIFSNVKQIQHQNISTIIVDNNLTKQFGVRKFHTTLSYCTTHFQNDNDTRLNIQSINNETLNSDRIIDEIVEDHEHLMQKKSTLTHVRSKEKYSLRDIERMYPNPKAKVHDIYQIITNELKNKEAIEISYTTEKQKKSWLCTIDVKWPFDMTFTSNGHNKNSAGNAACIKCLHYLENNRRLSPLKKPIIYSQLEVKNILHRPVRLEMNEQVIDEVKNLVDRYEDEVRPLIETFDKTNKSTYEFTTNDILDDKHSNFQPGAIVDPVGRSNPLTREQHKINERNKILQSRLEHRNANKDLKATNQLPIMDYRDEIIKQIENNQVLVIKGDTGCGKTTQVPQFIMDSYSVRGESTNCNIIVAQPRRISAISLAERIAVERKEQVGDVIGYQVRLSQDLPNTPAGILFCTTGILLRKLQFNPKLEGCSHVIVDEAHERTINTDVLLALLKRAMNNNKNLKIIIMSATINAGLFQNYFNCGVVEVPGRTYPVEMNFLEDIDAIGLRSPSRYDMSFDDSANKGEINGPSVDIVKMGELISWINSNQPQGAILCFLPGWSEIMKMKKYLEEFSTQTRRKHCSDIMVVPVHSKMSNFDQKKIFETPPNDTRKIVLATDIAETGITVTDVVYVVDSCTHRQVKWDDKRGITSINNHWASQANINQRKGRAGRVKSGTSYHFITREMYDNLEPYPIPEIKRSSLEKTVLDAKTYSNEKAMEFLSSMPEPPLSHVIQGAVNDLIKLGALDNDENLTPLGKRIALFTLHPKLSKSIVYSSIFECVGPMMTIASAMSADNQIFQGQLHNKDGIRKIKEKYSPTSDHTSVGWLFQQWYDANKSGRYESRDFCFKSRLYPDKMFTLSKVRELNAENLIHTKMMNNINDLDNFESKINSYSELDELVRGVLLAGTDQLLLQRDFDIRKGVLKKGTPTFTMEDGNRATVTPESVNFKRRKFPSPFLTYVMKTHSEERRTSLIRETSIISPLTAFLFSQGKFTGYFQDRDTNINLEDDSFDEDNNEVVLSIHGRKNMKLICTKDTADVMLKFRDAMWSVVRYMVTNQGVVSPDERQNYLIIDECKESMLQLLALMLSQASEKIDSPETKKVENNNNNNDDEDDDDDERQKDW
ncbi:ATP-dependent RNA helicase DHX30-like [Aphidius gifuensis]|uniref:ATP-dependent RNA helicase DHX30-like n=1 Tax=Aphidius gifuensis TaxID=684658 RepID=UPI001CDBD484|nr:ATP-dependent RNA helicase DHX30-like [Aphidius gifuensis]